MCASCGTGRPTAPWEDALGAGRAHRTLRARALTAVANSSSLRFSTDPAMRSYYIHPATAPQQTAYDLAQCCSHLAPLSPWSDAHDGAAAGVYGSAIVPACPLDIWAVVLQVHARIDVPHLVHVSNGLSGMTVNLHGAATTMIGPVKITGGPHLEVAGPHSPAIRRSLLALAAVLCERLNLPLPQTA